MLIIGRLINDVTVKKPGHVGTGVGEQGLFLEEFEVKRIA
jgi:hypothetical protein